MHYHFDEFRITTKRTRLLYCETGELPDLFTRRFYFIKFGYLFTEKVERARVGKRQRFEGAVGPLKPPLLINIFEA